MFSYDLIQDERIRRIAYKYQLITILVAEKAGVFNLLKDIINDLVYSNCLLPVIFCGHVNSPKVFCGFFMDRFEQLTNNDKSACFLKIYIIFFIAIKNWRITLIRTCRSAL